MAHAVSWKWKWELADFADFWRINMLGVAMSTTAIMLIRFFAQMPLFSVPPRALVSSSSVINTVSLSTLASLSTVSNLSTRGACVASRSF